MLQCNICLFLRLRKARTLESNQSEVEVPEALQQKSSALVPPTTCTAGQSVESRTVPTELQRDTDTGLPSSQSTTPSTSSEKMDIDTNDKKAEVDDKELSLISVDKETSSASSVGVSGPNPGLASESISPHLAAASLVAVCSSPQLPLQGMPVASVSGIQQSVVTDSKSVPSSDVKEGSASSAPSKVSKVDADSKAEESAKKAEESTDFKEAEKQGSGSVKSTDTCASDNNKLAPVESQQPNSPEKQPEQSKVTLIVAQNEDEAKMAPTVGNLPAVTQSTPQGTTRTAPSHGALSTSSGSASQNVIKTPPEEPSESKPSQSTTKSASQGPSPGVPHEPPKGTSSGTSTAASTVVKPTPSVISTIPVHLTQSTPPSSLVGQPLKTAGAKPLVTSETHRSAAVKSFQHLPAGMTAVSSKQFSAITSVSTKESNKDTNKVEPVKSQEQSGSAKL